jgi:predicted membrane-bound dolichyl-phosphate-mannose-protein mannosyltransferase
LSEINSVTTDALTTDTRTALPISRPASTERQALPASTAFVLGAALLAIAGLVVAWWLLGQLMAAGLYGHLVISDVSIYQGFGDPIVGGQLPYRDVPIEYPPGALPLFILPSLLRATPGDIDGYVRWFELLMLVCAAIGVASVAVVMRAVRATPTRTALALGFVAATPLLIGPMVLSHYDLWPAALTVVAVAALVSGRGRIGSAVLAASILAKVYAIVIAPLAIAMIWRRQGRREALIATGVLVGVVVGVVLPFFILAPDGVLTALERQANRPLQVESLGASLLFVLHGVAGLGVTVESSFGSQNLAGQLPDLLALAETLALGAVLLATWWWFARRSDAGREAFLRCAAIAVVAYVALGKVLSPQYLMWLVPLVPLVAGRRGVVACAILALACFATQLYFPGHYFDLVESLDAGVARIIFTRDVALVGLLAVLALPPAVLAPLLRLEPPLRARAGALAGAISRIQPETALGGVLLFALVVRAIWLWLPAGSLIFDEAYYVNAARIILGIPVAAGASYAGSPIGLDPNLEHPPLGKLLIAASILVFGDNGIGWRVPSLVAGLVGLVAVYRICRNAGETAWLGVLAAAIYSLDILSYVHGRIGTLDMMAVALMLLGASLALRRSWVLAGIALALATLVKETAVLGLAAVLILEGLDLWNRRRSGEALTRAVIRPTATLLGVFVVVSLGGLWLMDLRFTTFTNPIAHVVHMLTYGVGLTGGPTLNGIASNPWDWLVNGGQFDYLKVAVNSIGPDGTVIGSVPTIEFRALLNPVLVGTLVLSVPTAIYLAWVRGHRLATWAVVWMAANYLPFVYLGGVSHRISYLYYILPTIPAFAIAAALLLMRMSLPRLASWVFLGASLLAFAAYFPFRVIP